MNIAAWLERAGETHGDRAALACGAEVVRTYREMARRVAGVATGLRQTLALEEGGRVAIVAVNQLAYLEALFATWWAGMVAVPINAKLHAYEIAWIFDHAGISAAFVSQELEPTVAGARPAYPAHFIVLGGPEYERLAACEPNAVTSCEGHRVAWLFYTSGTTGRPKGAMLTHRNLIAMSLAHLVDLDPTEPGDTLVHGAPLSHGSGLLVPAHVLRGGLNVTPESGAFEASEVMALIRRWRKASLFAAPTMIRRLVEAPDEVDATAIRSIIWGGAPMHVPDIKRALDRFGPCLSQLYGQGESPMTITALSKAQVGDREHPRWLARLASAGTARSPVQLRIAAADDSPLPCGEPGEILVRGETVMAGYWRDSEASESTLRNRWLHTGDIGVLDDEGFLTLRDRSKDVIISGGANIYPREVEEVLALHSGVREAAVIGRPDDEWGEVVVAYVVGTVRPEELDQLCLERIARFKRPKDYVFVDDLPKNDYGKIRKNELRDRDDQRLGAAAT